MWAGYDGKGVPAIDEWYASNNIELEVKYISNENLVNFFKSPGAEKWDQSSVNQGDAEYVFAQEISSEISVEEVIRGPTRSSSPRNTFSATLRDPTRLKLW